MSHKAEMAALRAECARLREALESIVANVSVASGKRISELVIPAPRLDRWWERQVAEMVGQVVTVDGRRATVKWSGPLDGTPEEGASAIVLIVEAEAK